MVIIRALKALVDWWPVNILDFSHHCSDTGQKISQYDEKNVGTGGKKMIDVEKKQNEGEKDKKNEKNWALENMIDVQINKGQKKTFWPCKSYNGM